MGLREWIAGKAVAGNRQEALVGKLGAGPKAVWQFLDGWKSWIVAVVLVAKIVCADCSGLSYVDAILKALGWDPSIAAFDPAQAVAAGAVIVALGHRLLKAIQQYREGRPVVALLSEAPK